MIPLQVQKSLQKAKQKAKQILQRKEAESKKSARDAQRE